MDLLSALLGAGVGAGASAAARSLREYRTEPADPADVLNWAYLVDEGVVLMKDGSFLTGWRYRGPDMAAATEEELDVLSAHVNDALLPFTDRWMLHVDAVRRPARKYAGDLPGGFPEAVTRLIDEERRDAYESAGQFFDTEYYLVVTHTPPPEVFSRLGALFVNGADPWGVDWPQVLEHFHGSVQSLENQLSGRLRLDRLASDDLLTHLHVCLTGLHHPVCAPWHGSYLNCVLADRPIVGGFQPKVGDLHVRPVAVMGYPCTDAGVLDLLNHLGFGYRWSSRVIPLGPAAAEKEIRKHQLNWFKKQKGLMQWVREIVSGSSPRSREEAERWIDRHARSMEDDTGEALAENAAGDVRFCRYTSTIVVMEEDPRHAGYVASQIVKGLGDAGFPARVETVNAVEAYLGSLPGHGYPNLRRPLLSSANVADLLPTTGIWSGLAENPSRHFARGSPALMWTATDGSTPFRLNLHDGDVGHTLVIGRTGAGKSVLVESLAAQWRRYPDAQVFYFDHGYSAWLLAAACGWTHYAIAAGRVDSLGFQPLGRIDDAAERAWAAEWLEVVFGLHGITLEPSQRRKIDAALRLLAEMDREHRTLTDLRVQLQDKELQEALRFYTIEGNLGYLLDAKDDCLDDAAVQVFELKHLLEMGDLVLIPTLLYLFRRVERRLDAGRPTLIPIEELWAPLLRSVFANRISQWLLTLRKQNAAVLLVAHSVQQLRDLPNRQIITESCPTKIFLPNPEARAPDTRRLYAEIGLNAREIDVIAEGVPKRHYYFKSPHGSRRFELGLGPLAMAFMAPAEGTTLDQTRRQVETLAERWGNGWPEAWLRERGLEEWADRFKRFKGGPDDKGSCAA